MYHHQLYLMGLRPLIFACLYLVVTSEPGKGSVVIYEKLSWKKAFDKCTGKGDGFNFPLTENGNLLGLQLWLPIQKSRYPTWKWLDDRPVDKSFVQQNWRRTMHCGAFHLRDGLLEAEECNRNSVGALCDATGKYVCKDSDAGCFIVFNRTFSYQCAVNNWFEAKHLCKQRGLVLAMVRSPEVMKELKTLYKNLKFSCMRLWVGLRREDWYLYSHNGREGEDTFQMKWASQQPSPDGNCAVQYTDTTGSIKWKTEYCGAEHHWRCHHVSPVTEEPQENVSKYRQTEVLKGVTTNDEHLITEASQEQRAEGESQKRADKNMTGVIVGVTVPIFIVCIIAFICLYIKMKRNRHPQSLHQVPEEGLPLMGTLAASSFEDTTSMFNRSANLVMRGSCSSKGGILSDRLSDIRLKIQEGTIPESESLNIICKVHSDMEPESYQLSSEHFLIMPVVELQGLKNGIPVEVEFEHALKKPHKLQAFKASISEDGQLTWTTDVKHIVDDRKLVIYADDTQASYTFALSKRENVDDFYNRTAAFFYHRDHEGEKKQNLFISAYLIRTCNNLSDYLYYLHGHLDGNETCKRLTDVFTKALITGVDAIDILFEWSDPTWKETGQEGQYILKEFSMDKTTRNCNGVKIAEYQMSRRVCDSPATEFPMHFVIRDKNLPNNDPFLDLEHLVQL